MYSETTFPNFPVPVDHSMEALPMDCRLRQMYPDDLFPNGAYAALPYGRVRYWLMGPQDGIKVVLIHGLSTPAITWKDIAPYLAERGFRLLVYDLYGKGYSEAPKVPSTTTLFITQLALLMQYVHWDSANIVGFSMGGGICAAFCSTFPWLVGGKAAFVSAAGLLSHRSRCSAHKAHRRFRDLQTAELPGYVRSLNSCRKVGPLRALEPAYDKLAEVVVGAQKTKLAVLVVHGTADEVVPLEEADKIKRRVPQAEVVKVEGAMHDIVVSEGHWQQLAQALARFLA
ncbi:alpha/beta-hydrolase [Epithele typhae]|uniref:alpha/beta-hydrolase n=1 Tax=Epithele typhae TaxID=378194 RepID=UPI002007840E|nr:alpha/beta-hydrolase [Epithele typhae]KAH9944428.1 alpha/beta-hydrolase [Epithele typhae]